MIFFYLCDVVLPFDSKIIAGYSKIVFHKNHQNNQYYTELLIFNVRHLMVHIKINVNKYF